MTVEVVESFTRRIVPVLEVRVLVQHSNLHATFLVVPEVVGLIGAPVVRNGFILITLALPPEGLDVRIVDVKPPSQSDPSTSDPMDPHLCVKGLHTCRFPWDVQLLSPYHAVLLGISVVLELKDE